MGIRFSDIGAVGGFLSGAFILGASLPVFAKALGALPVIGSAVGGALTTAAGALGSITPAFLAGAGAKVAAIATGLGMGFPALAAVAAIGLAIAVPWAIRMTGNVLDAAVAQAEYGVEKVKTVAINGTEKLKFRREYKQAPVVVPAMAEQPNYHREIYHHPAERAEVRGVSFQENYLKNQQQEVLAAQR